MSAVDAAGGATSSTAVDGRGPHSMSIVVPVYYNEPSLAPLHARLLEEAARHPETAVEIVFVDDGSGDGSFRELERLATADPRVRVVKLTRNFGSHNACLAGMSVATGDVVAVIAADLQEPPDLPWTMLARWSPEVPVVVASRRSRDEDFSKVLFARIYYRVMRQLAFPHLPRGGFDCFLVGRRVAREITALNESNTSLNGLVLWTGFGFAEVAYDRLGRPFGRSRWTFTKRLKLLVDSVVAFSFVPVRAMSALGVSIGAVGFLYAAAIVVRKLAGGEDVSGWSSLMAALMVLSGVQLIALGILGEYVWRTLDAARRRPNFIIEGTRNLDVAPSAERPAGSVPAAGADQ